MYWKNGNPSKVKIWRQNPYVCMISDIKTHLGKASSKLWCYDVWCIINPEVYIYEKYLFKHFIHWFIAWHEVTRPSGLQGACWKLGRIGPILPMPENKNVRTLLWKPKQNIIKSILERGLKCSYFHGKQSR